MNRYKDRLLYYVNYLKVYRENIGKVIYSIVKAILIYILKLILLPFINILIPLGIHLIIGLLFAYDFIVLFDFAVYLFHLSLAFVQKKPKFAKE